MDNLEKLIQNLVEYINTFENAMQQHYSLQGLPYLGIGKKFPKKGSIVSKEILITFNYHGAGCTVNYDSLILDYDVYISDENHIKLSPWKLGQFVNSFLKEDVNIDRISQEMERLSRIGILNKLPEGLAYYEINLEYYRKKSGTDPQD